MPLPIKICPLAGSVPNPEPPCGTDNTPVILLAVKLAVSVPLTCKLPDAIVLGVFILTLPVPLIAKLLPTLLTAGVVTAELAVMLVAVTVCIVAAVALAVVTTTPGAATTFVICIVLALAL